jgi:DNA topoisomerase-1
MSGTAIANATQAIESRFGSDTVSVRKYVNKKSSAQEAHECIRPTDFSKDSAGSESQEQRLYKLIRQRSIASQMTDAQCEKTTVKIALSQSSVGFTASGEVIKSPGFLLAYGIDAKTTIENREDSEDKDDRDDISNQGLPILEVWQLLDLQKMIALTNYDRYPARYTEASLVKKLEAEGIGRPSTYAPTISTILKRQYVVMEDREGVMKEFQKLELSQWVIKEEILLKPYGAERKKLFPTDTGMVVTDFLIAHFPEIVDYGFTAKVEEELDEIAEGRRDWRQMMDVFYKPFHVTIVQAWWEAVQRASGERILGTDPKTGRQVSVRLGRFGAFVQLGLSDDTDKVYSSLKTGQRLDTITLEEALTCFDLPRKLWLHGDQEMVVSIGRFGPYVKYWSLFVSLGKELDPYTITAEEAKVLIDNKIQNDKDKLIHTFDYNGTECKVENWRYGPFIRYGKFNIKIPKELHEKIKTVSDKDRVKIVQEGEWAAAVPKRSWGKK